MNNSYKTTYINSFDTAALNSLSNVLKSVDNSYDDPRSSVIRNFKHFQPTNIKAGTYIGSTNGIHISTPQDITLPLIEPMIKYKQIYSSYRYPNPFTAQYSIKHPNGYEIYGCYRSTSKPGIYCFNTITNEEQQIFDKSAEWGYFAIDNKGFIYCSVVYSDKNNIPDGLYVITPDKQFHYIYDKDYRYRTIVYRKNYLYLYGRDSGCDTVLCIDNSTPIPTVINSLSEASSPYAFEGFGDDDMCVLSGSGSNFTGGSGVHYMTPTSHTHFLESLGRHNNNAFEGRDLRAGDYIYLSATYGTNGIWAFDKSLNEYHVYPSYNYWFFTIVNDDCVIASTTTDTKKVLIIRGTEVLCDISSEQSGIPYYINGDYIYIFVTNGFYIYYNGTVTKAYKGAVDKDANKSNVKFYKVSDTEGYLVLDYVLYYIDHLTVSRLLSVDDIYSLYVYPIGSNGIIVSASSSSSYGFRGLRKYIKTTATYLIQRTDSWNCIFETSSNGLYISSTRSSNASIGASYYDSPMLGITGLYYYDNNTCTQIYGGYRWDQGYEDNNGNVYLSSTAQPSHGILKVDGTNVKRIWDRSVSFQYVQETPNGLLVADTEFIGPDDKILYIKGDRVMETSINEINAYNKEATNE